MDETKTLPDLTVSWPVGDHIVSATWHEYSLTRRLRQAKRGIWEFDYVGYCDVCRVEERKELNVLGICQACNFKDKMCTIGIIAEPAALRMVRREHGINGESDRADRERKVRRAEAEGETY